MRCWFLIRVLTFLTLTNAHIVPIVSISFSRMPIYAYFWRVLVILQHMQSNHTCTTYSVVYQIWPNYSSKVWNDIHSVPFKRFLCFCAQESAMQVFQCHYRERNLLSGLYFDYIKEILHAAAQGVGGFPCKPPPCVPHQETPGKHLHCRMWSSPDDWRVLGFFIVLPCLKSTCKIRHLTPTCSVLTCVWVQCALLWMKESVELKRIYYG